MHQRLTEAAGRASAEPADAPLYRLNDVGKIYRGRGEQVPIFSHLNLTIAQGQFVALMGPSGSGKSTLLNILGGIDKPTSGEVQFRGERINAMSEGRLAALRARHIGFVFQSYNLIPVLTALQNVEIPLLLTGLGRSKRRANAGIALDLVGLADRARFLPRKLSGGQQQRVAIARAIVSDPTVVLCDEPTGNLDRATADDLLGLLQALNREHGKTIVMATHDPDAAKYARTVLHIDKGKLMEHPSR